MNTDKIKSTIERRAEAELKLFSIISIFPRQKKLCLSEFIYDKIQQQSFNI